MVSIIVNIILIGVLAYQAFLFRKTAKATQKYADVSEDTAYRQLRAYVCVDEAVVEWVDDDTPRTRIAIRNSGQTPAYKTKQWVGIGIEKEPLNVPLEVPDSLNPSTGVLGANSIMTVVETMNPSASESQMALFRSGIGAVYVWGEIQYIDAFNKPHYTKYRLLCSGTEGLRTGSLKFHAEGNEAD